VTPDLARRRSLLIAALAALRVKASEPELVAVHRWLRQLGRPTNRFFPQTERWRQFPITPATRRGFPHSEHRP